MLNIATTTGFPQQIVYNDLERVCFIGVVYIGDAIFSIAFGMMASNSDVVFDKFPQNTENRIKIESLLDPGPGNNNYEPVKKKLKKYFDYLIELKSHNLSYLDTLRPLIPHQLVIFMLLKNIFILKLLVFRDSALSNPKNVIQSPPIQRNLPQTPPPGNRSEPQANDLPAKRFNNQ